MIEILKINIWKVYVNDETLFIEQECYIFMSLAQASCAVAASLQENDLNNISTL